MSEGLLVIAHYSKFNFNGSNSNNSLSLGLRFSFVPSIDIASPSFIPSYSKNDSIIVAPTSRFGHGFSPLYHSM